MVSILMLIRNKSQPKAPRPTILAAQRQPGERRIIGSRTQVASLENEREMRVKLEKLLEVQTVQVDLQSLVQIYPKSGLK